MKDNYSDTLNWLFSQLPMYQKTGEKALKEGLSNIITICEAFGNPQEKFNSIHIAGTNGKGSTGSLIASALIENKFKTGLTLSPHILDIRERLSINGELCEKDFVIDFVHEFRRKLPSLQASFFEVMIAMAFQYFAVQKVDMAVIETGLGGRLDSTNILKPELSVITNISLDHTHYLGDTLAKIASEKAGIIKEHTPVIVGEKRPETEFVFKQQANKKNAPLFFAEDFPHVDIKSDLTGLYQKENIHTSWHALHSVLDLGLEKELSKKGFAKTRQNAGLRGRWEQLEEKPKIIVDTGHNTGAMEWINKQLKQENYKNLHVVLGFVKDKDIAQILTFFPSDANYYFTQPQLDRKFPIIQLKEMIGDSLTANYYDNVIEAVKAAKSKAGANDFIYIGGSSFIVAEVLADNNEKTL